MAYSKLVVDLSVPHIKIPDDLLLTQYCVTRTSGDKELMVISCNCLMKWPAAFKDSKGVWRIFMDNNLSEYGDYVAGWRRITMIYPIHLSKQEHEQWRQTTIHRFDDLLKSVC
jgi:hypothetical protein